MNSCLDELVELRQLVHGEVSLNLLLVHHAGGQGLLGHLPVVDLLLHGALGQEPAHTQHKTRSR